MELFELIPIEQDGSIKRSAVLPQVAIDFCKNLKEAYELRGFVPPWIGYLAFLDLECVGSCAFQGAPEGSAIEISYLTFSEHAKKGIATRMTRALLEIARQAGPGQMLKALTLPQEAGITHLRRASA